MEPCLKDLAAREAADLGYSSRVPDFTVGRVGYEYVRFLGNTDARWLDLDRIVKFNRHELVVYEDESSKPEVGQGLNKAAEVTLILQNSAQKMSHRSSPPVARKTPLALLEYHPCSFDSDNHGILMAQQNKGMPLKKLKADGFQLDLKHETPVTGSHSRKYC
ncbi:hypothetical protein Q3G72_029980 [Acer saccharum]|nr:hypothetical protein Q3G72_029980 [Acer saccharum]